MLKAQFRLDVGLRRLLPEWKELTTRRYLGSDLAAGLAVACVAVPLSLAIALASGVPPAVGLVTAIVAGVVCALFGGTRLQVSGPAAAMAVLVASIVQEQGMAALLIVGVACGILQLAFGVLGLGRFIRLVPLPVIEGFTAGIGAIILIGQLPRALGLPPPAQSHVFDVVPHVGELLSQTKPAAVGIVALTLAVIYGMPRITRRVPAYLVAVAVATGVVVVFGIDVAPIGAIPRSLPSPSFPELPRDVPLTALAGSALVVFAVASLETLLSATAADKMSSGPRSDPDRELIGQGLGNIATALFGGIPVTGVIARTGANIAAGAKTRRASVFHSIAMLGAVFAFGPWMERIPIAALAGVLFSVAFRMLAPASFLRMWRQSRGDGTVYAVTFVTIVFVDLLEGIQWGVVAALAIAAMKLGRTRLVIRGARLGKHYLFALEGPLTFLSSIDVDSIREEVGLLESGRSVVFDLRGVGETDASGAEMLADLVGYARQRGLEPLVIGLDGAPRGPVVSALGHDQASSVLVPDERALAQRLGVDLASADSRLRAGIERYRSTSRAHYAPLFERLATGQAPHTLLITCSDSRVDPTLITASDPGELFVVRDIGNLVPPSASEAASAVGAAIDFAVGILKVSKIVVCGHSGCGAIKALVARDGIPTELHHLGAWLEASDARSLLRSLPRTLGLDEIGKLNVLSQIEHLRTYEVVAEKLRSGELSLAAWFFDVARGEIEEWADGLKRFVPVGEGSAILEPAPAPASAR